MRFGAHFRPITFVHHVCLSLIIGGHTCRWYLPATIPIKDIAGCVVCVKIILGALPIPKGAVPVLARGLGHTAPTYAVGSRIDKTRTACAART